MTPEKLAREKIDIIKEAEKIEDHWLGLCGKKNIVGHFQTSLSYYFSDNPTKIVTMKR